MFDQQDLGAIDGAVSGVQSWLDVLPVVNQLVPSLAVAALQEAFSYHLAEVEDSPGGARSWVFRSLTGGPSLDAVGDERLAQWAELASSLTAPLLRVHLNHLLWARKYGNAIDYCRAAINDYVEVAALPLDRGVTAVTALQRASELALRTRNKQALDAIGSSARALLGAEAEARHLGSVLGLLEVLSAAQPDDLDALFAAAEAQFPAAHAKDRLHDRWADAVPGSREKVRHAQIDLRLAEADRTADQVMVRLSWLERAYALAGRFAPERQRAILLLLQEIKPDDIPFARISEEFELPEAERAAYLTDVTSAKSLEEALYALGLLQPLGGTDAEIDEALAEQAEETVFTNLLSTTFVGSHSAAPVARLDPGTDERKASDRAQFRALGVGVMGVWATQALGDIGGRFQPTEEQLAHYFTRPHIDERRAARIARAFRLFLDRHPDDAAHIVLPRIEGALRTWADQMGLPIITMPKGQEFGGVRTLGGLLLELRPFFGDMYGPHLSHVLTERFGSNLRNNVLHGLSAEVGVTDAALLLQITCLVALLPPRDELEAVEETEGDKKPD